MEKLKTIETIKQLSKFISKNLAEKMEKGIYDFSNEYSITYETPFLLESIYDTKLSEILEGLCNNETLVDTEEDAYSLPFKGPEVINPNKYDKLLEKKKIEEYKKNDVKSSTAFTCSKCKESKCKVSQKQIRAGDEPATTFVTCLVCDHTFSFN